ncbi:MAG: GNAT family N-acetyltransferase [Chloroflexi bacterium]|nr:MAG: GNAT family N-acetyltransferase [Chloroflexota bacterium]
MLWVEADGTLVAYALIAPSSTVLTFQVHPQARGSGLEAQMLAWAIARAQEQTRQCGRTFSLRCSCHESETERRALLEEADFKPLPARDLRLVRSLDIPLPAPHERVFHEAVETGCLLCLSHRQESALEFQKHHL